MLDNQPHTATPLATLLAMLKAEGFQISTAAVIDIQKVLVHIGTAQRANLQELRYLLGPLICRNKEEQEHFNSVFSRYEKHIREERKEEPDPAVVPGSFNSKLKVIAAVASILIFILAAYYSFFHHRSVPAIHIVTVGEDTTQSIIVNEPVTFIAQLADTNQKASYIVEYRIDDSIYRNKRRVEKTFNKAGSHLLEAWLFDDNHDTVSNFRNDNLMVLCEKKPDVFIAKAMTAEKNLSNERTKTRYTPVLINPSIDSVRYSYTWFVDNKPVSRQRILDTVVSRDQPSLVRLVINCKGIHCSTDSLTAEFTDTPEYSFAVSGSKPLLFKNTLNWKSIALAVLVYFLLPGSIAAIALFVKRRKPAIDPAEKSASNVPQEYSPPYKIEFKKQDEKISVEKEVGQLAETMRKRHVSETMVLDVKRTILQTIRSGGFPILQFGAKTQPTDFLFFINKENADSHQVKLFEFVIKKLQNDQVIITPYNFHKEPLLLSNEKLNQSMLSVEKIAGLYPNTILFIFSDANAFFAGLSRKLKPWVTEKFKSWKQKILLTPTPTNDWDYKETALLQAGFTVVPADLNGKELITAEINDLINKNKPHAIQIPASYSSRFIDFDDWADLQKYLNEDERLLKWICALSVYPYLDWRVTVALGKALEANDTTSEKLVTYTNLLKLSRITWMQTGVLGDELRLQMMRNLDKTTEAIARKAMVELLQEIEADIPSTSLVKGEFELNKTINKFLLHTYNPLENHLSDKERLAMKEYSEKEFLDYPLEKVLDEGNSLLTTQGSSENITLKQYFTRQDAEENRKLVRERIIRRSIALAAMLLGLFFLGRFMISDSNYRSHQRFADIRFNHPRYLQVSVLLNDSLYKSPQMNDSTTIFRGLPVDSNAIGKLIIKSIGNDVPYETILDMKSQEYTITANTFESRAPLYIRYNNTDTYGYVQQQLDSALSNYNITSQPQNFSDSSRIVYSDASQRPRVDSITRIINQVLGIQVRAELNNGANASSVPVLFLNLTKGADSSKRDAGYYHKLADGYLSKSQYLQAVEAYTRAIVLDPKDAFAYYNRGICFENLNDFQKAIDSYTGAIQLYSKDAMSYYRRATVKYKLQNYADAISDYNKVILINSKYAKSDYAYSFYYRGKSKLSLKDINGACADFKKSVELGIREGSQEFEKWCGGSQKGADLSQQGQKGAEPATPTADCSRTFYSIKETEAVDRRIVCKLDLSKENYTSLPKEVYQFINLKELNVGNSNIPLNEIESFQKSVPGCKVISNASGNEANFTNNFRGLVYKVSFGSSISDVLEFEWGKSYRNSIGYDSLPVSTECAPNLVRYYWRYVSESKLGNYIGNYLNNLNLKDRITKESIVLYSFQDNKLAYIQVVLYSPDKEFYSKLTSYLGQNVSAYPARYQTSVGEFYFMTDYNSQLNATHLIMTNKIGYNFCAGNWWLNKKK